MSEEKPIHWMGTSLGDLMAFPDDAKQGAGYQLHRVQIGMEPEDWKPFKTVGPGTKEIRISEGNGIYRIMYVAKFEEVIYVLHSFQKKTQQTAKKDIDVAKARYQAAMANHNKR